MLTDPEFVKRLETLFLLARKVLGGTLRADRKSEKKGSGILFADHSEYSFGDDYRSIDWNIYARFQNLVVRLYELEEDTSIYILLDLSHSMQAKSEYARKLAAALGYIALSNTDRLAIYSLSDNLRTVLETCHGRGKTFPMLRALEAAQCYGHDTQFTRCMRSFKSISRRRGVCVLISDFFTPAGYQDGLSILQWCKHDVFCLQVLDPAELSCPWKGDIELECVETSARRQITISPVEAARYSRAVADWNNNLQRECARREIGFARAGIDIPFEDIIQKILRRGGARGMSLLQPGMLWFLFLLLPLLPVYLLKVRPVRRQTTTFFFWDQILKQKKASALFRRLRDILSLLLLAAVLCALVGAMAKPSFVSKENQKDLLILIDNSASMAASPGTKSRLGEAKQVGSQLIRAMPMDRRAMLVSVATELRPLVNLTSNQRTLMEGLELLDQSDLPFRPQALDSLRRSREVREKSRIILISDGCFTGSEALEGIELLKIGKPCPNLGIVGFDLSRVPGAKDSLEFYFQLISSFKEPKDVDVLLCRETPDNVVKVCPVTVQPGENPPEIFSIEPGPSGRWLLILDIKDSLDKDNIAYAVVPEIKPIRIAVRADDSGFFFAQCVKAFSEDAGVMTLAQTQPEVLLSSAQPIDKQAAS